MQISRNFRGVVDRYEKALQVVNSLDWNISARPRQNDEWVLFAGDQEVGIFSSRSELEAFVTGMGLAIGVLPKDVIQHIKKIIE